MTSLYYFHPLSFLFVPSPMYILNSPTPTLFLVWTKYRDRLDDQSVLLSPPFLPVCTKSDVHTKFPHPHFISCLNQVQDSTPWSSFTSNNRRRKIGDVGPSDREGLRGRKWCTCSDVASWGSRAKAVSNEDIPEGRRDVDRWAAGFERRYTWRSSGCG